LNVIKLLKIYDKTKPWLEKVEAFLYVLQHITQKEAAPYFDTASILLPNPNVLLANIQFTPFFTSFVTRNSIKETL
jgi:hypothetical protein